MKNKFYIGIDPSMTSTGLIILDDDYNIVVQKNITSDSKLPNEERIKNIGDELIHEIDKITDDKFVCIEGISYGSIGRGVAQQAALNFYIRILLLKHDILYVICEPSTLKKFVTGKGQCKKDLMLMKTFKKWKVEFENSDVCDAYGLARFGKDGKSSSNDKKNK
jgi:crossover junction endodeoxyribonuclease RuvC